MQVLLVDVVGCADGMAGLRALTGFQPDSSGSVPKRAILGNLVLLSALAMMSGLVGSEIGAFKSWAEATAPQFVGKLLLHSSTVIGAYVGGRLIPHPQPKPDRRRRPRP